MEKRSLKVVHVTPYYLPAAEWGGPVRSTHLLCRSLVQAGMTCQVVTTNQRGTRDLPRAAPGCRELDGVEVHFVAAAPLPRRYFFAPGLIRRLRSVLHFADIVHLHGLWTFPQLVAARTAEALGIPYIVSPRGSLDPWALGFRAWKKKPYYFAVERQTLREAAAVHFTSQDEWALSPPWVRTLPRVVIPNPVEVETVHQEGTPSGEILFVGRIHPMKGLDILLRALALLREDTAPRLRIVGPDEAGYQRELEELAGNLGISNRLVWTGPVAPEEVKRFYRRASVLALPSHRENFGNVVAEAMALGVPVVISSNVNLAPDVSGANAGIVTSMEPDEVARALGRLLERPELAQSMGNNGRSLVAAKFEAKAVARTTVQAYRELLK